MNVLQNLSESFFLFDVSFLHKQGFSFHCGKSQRLIIPCCVFISEDDSFLCGHIHQKGSLIQVFCSWSPIVFIWLFISLKKISDAFFFFLTGRDISV